MLEVTCNKRAQGLELLNARIFPSNSVGSYVAMSHVCADGLGNPFENALPTCLFQSLIDKVAKLMEHLSEYRSLYPNKIYVWLDVLCCPAGPPELKALGIKQMGKTHQNSSQTLVIDNDIKGFDITPASP